VYYGTMVQLPQTLREITRLRELTFRDMQEGSGAAVDTDAFDETYLQLFVWDTERSAIVGGYRLGQTDELRAREGNAGIYLGIMFDFDEAFYAGPPMLEIGRSFVTPDYQRSHSSLYLLWCGIGRYLVQNPKYRRVYGVVSMSRLYDSRTIAALRDALLEPEAQITPKAAYAPDLGDQWREYLARNKPLPMRDVSKIVKALEAGQRDVPVLIRHYHKLGAQFLSAAVDGNFNNTPGLLLHLDVPAIPPKYLKQYFGQGMYSYLEFNHA
jgi:putative hemolysin